MTTYGLLDYVTREILFWGLTGEELYSFLRRSNIGYFFETGVEIPQGLCLGHFKSSGYKFLVVQDYVVEEQCDTTFSDEGEAYEVIITLPNGEKIHRSGGDWIVPLPNAKTAPKRGVSALSRGIIL